MPILSLLDIEDNARESLISAPLPLYVDLDGTLVRTDMLWESALSYVSRAPWRVFLLPFLLFKGCAALKRHIAERTDVRPETLPFNQEFLEWLQLQRALGRRLILATASDMLIARKIANHLQIFDDVMGSDGVTNLKGSKKLLRIQQLSRSFDYAGDSTSDRIIWQNCNGIVSVCAGSDLAADLRNSGKIKAEFPRKRRSLNTLLNAIRAHQWSKNILIFVPVLTSHRMFDSASAVSALVLFLGFNFLASATYLFNDLLDITPDREHPRKRLRALARGDLSIPEGIALAALLGIVGTALASVDGFSGLTVALSYVLVSTLYTFVLKRMLLVDVFTLAGLYTLRIIAGGLVTGIVISGWLMSFSVFLFLSLGFSKRAAELLRRSKQDGESSSTRRAYLPSDCDQINQFGVASGFVSALILALYIGSDQVRLLYQEPNWLWFMIPLFLYWITRLWLIAHRGELNEDPVAFAMKDKTTFIVSFGCLVAGLLAASVPHLGFMK